MLYVNLPDCVKHNAAVNIPIVIMQDEKIQMN